ncbi:MAG TPA: ABC transporter ATP-binding protein [Hydrogenispora sp.]|jgi:branched-chain amino acid transport system ATP-binding protein|nr:ABC transporter ATP-binding protein [Hydrogenispora sp.]
MSLLKIEDVTMNFGGLTALKSFNLQLMPGEIVGLIGPNGAGKTTVFNIITGVYEPSQGRIFFMDQEITGMRPDLITKAGIARTFQNIRLFPGLSVMENVLIANHLHLKANYLEAVFKLPSYRREERQMREKSLALLERVGLIDLRDEQASALPYGLQRRLEIARALATDPKLLLLDEPAAGMNPKEAEDLTTFIKEIQTEFDLTIFLIEHHMDVVMNISERIYVLDYGMMIASGKPEAVQNNQRVIEAYLGVNENAED